MAGRLLNRIDYDAVSSFFSTGFLLNRFFFFFVRTGCVVFGLPSVSTNESLHRAFSPFGKVVRAMIAINRRTNQYIGTVVFEDETSARKAVKRMNGKKIDGHQITVKEYRFPEFPPTDPLSPEVYARLGRLGCVVYGLPSGTTNESLKRAFSPFGKVVRVIIAFNRRTNQDFGTVVFEDEASTKEAVERMNLKEIDGHQITVKESRFPEFPPGSPSRLSEGFYFCFCFCLLLLLMILDHLDVSSMVWGRAPLMSPLRAHFLSSEMSSMRRLGGMLVVERKLVWWCMRMSDRRGKLSRG